MTDKRRTIQWKWLIPALIALAIFATIAIIHMTFRSAVDAELAAIRKAGYPATSAEIADWLGEAPEENAAELLTEAFSLMDTTDPDPELPFFGEGKWPDGKESLSDTTINASRKFLASNKDALDMLHEAAKIGQGRFPADWSDGIETHLPHLEPVRSAAKLLCLEALIHAEAGETQKAADSLVASLTIGQTLHNDTMLLSQLVRIATVSLSVDTAEALLAREDFNDEQLASLADAFADCEHEDAMYKAMIVERCCFSSIFQELRSEPVIGPLTKSSAMMIPYRIAGLMERDYYKYLAVFDEFIKACQLPLHERQAAMDAYQRKVEDISRTNIMARIVLLISSPSDSRAVELDTTAIAESRIARTALAVQRYRLKYNKLPETLDELVPTYFNAIPKDPFDGKDVRYKHLPTAYVVYSIGSDGIDNGGKKLDESNCTRTPGTDIVFTVER